MKTVQVRRRQVLRGAGGFTLALPFLPSLIARRADGADVIPGAVKRLIVFTSEHGRLSDNNLYPAAGMLTNRHQLFQGHEISYGTLKATRTGADNVLSRILSAPATELTPALIAKMNVIRGFGMPFELRHHGGGQLGNFADNSGQSLDGLALQRNHGPTVDQVIAHAPSFYGNDLASVRVRGLFVGNGGLKSWYYSNPTTRSGTIEPVSTTTDTLKLFNNLFGTSPSPTPGGAPPRKPVVDRVLVHYKNMVEGNRRLSSADKQRLTDHMARLGELERRLTIPATVVECGKKPEETAISLAAARSARLPDSIKRYQLVNEVIAMAFMCNVNRVAVVANVDTYMPDFNGDWHQDIGHGGVANSVEVMTTSQHNKFLYQILDMARRLDVPEFGGNTFLDNSLLYWSNEAGDGTHWQGNLPVVTFGSANGFFKTGQYIDYRNVAGKKTDPRASAHYVGLTYQRWLANMALSMGLKREEFERAGKPGFGEAFIGSGYQGKFVPGVIETSSEVPFPLKA